MRLPLYIGWRNGNVRWISPLRDADFFGDCDFVRAMNGCEIVIYINGGLAALRAAWNKGLGR